jgi:predicted nucleic acid-binding protein
VKLYADESGHAAVRSLDTIVISMLARVEVPAALWRKHRLGELDAADTRILVDAFEADLFGDDHDPPRFVTVAVPPQLLDSAARLTAVHGLRAYDSVQLASACAAQHADPLCATFACFDSTLRRAAAAEGFELVPSSI